MSISNQRAFLLGYVRERGWTAAAEYADDGWSGTTFQRPAFQRLLADIEARRIDTVVTKDLSRLGRDQIGTLYYYQVYFPTHGVRYIAVNEGVDTASGLGNSLALPFLAAANDFYTADISRKVRTALDTRRREGLFIGSAPPLGYQKDPAQKGHLLPDPTAAWVAVRVFQTYLALESVLGTAKALTRDGVPTPAACRSGAGGGVWSDTMVRRILTNPTYAGHLTQRRTEKLGYKVNRRRTLSAEEWVTIPNTHAPLVSQADFDQAQRLLRTHSYTPAAGARRLLTGLVFCACCGAPMACVRTAGGAVLVCSRYRRSGRLGLCTPHRVREAAVLQALTDQLRRLSAEIGPEALVCAPNRRKKAEEPQRAVQAARRLLAFDPPERRTLVTLVERVLVGERGELELVFRFRAQEG